VSFYVTRARDVSAVNLPSKFLPVKKFTVNFTFFSSKLFFKDKKMLCGVSNQMKSKTPSLNCKEIFFLSTDNYTIIIVLIIFSSFFYTIINTKVKSKYKCFGLKRNKGYVDFDS